MSPNDSHEYHKSSPDPPKDPFEWPKEVKYMFIQKSVTTLHSTLKSYSKKLNIGVKI